MSEADKPIPTSPGGTYAHELKALSEFVELVTAYDEDLHGDGLGGIYEGAKAKEIRPKINRILPAVDEILGFVGISPVVVWVPAPMIGGPPRRINVINNIFNIHHFEMGMDTVLDYVERARGLLEHLAETGRLPASQREGETTGIDLLSGLERAVRQAFSVPPQEEKRDLHPVVRVVLTSLKIPFTVEQERVAYAASSAIPDFVLWDRKCVLEVKLIKESKDLPRITSEINDDILKYGSRFPRKIFLIYDCGTLRDVEGFRREFMRPEGVYVLVVKH